MKHLLNNLSNEEKNRIREQYEGGMSVDNSRFKKLMESKLGNVKPLITEEENTGTTQTISQMLQRKEFRGLTKNVTGDGSVHYELWNENRRLWYVKFVLMPDGSVLSTVGADDPKYFDMVEAMYNSLDGFSGEKIGIDKSDPEAVKGRIKTKLDKQQVAQLFDALEKSYRKNKDKITT